MATKVSQAQLTIVDTNDYIFTGTTAPVNPSANLTTWIDKSVSPPLTKTWSGTAWIVVNDTTDIRNAAVVLNNKVDGNDGLIRSNLNLSAPLLSTVVLDGNGVTANNGAKYARLGAAGLEIRGGAIDIRTGTATNVGVLFDGLGIRGYNASNVKTFELDTNGNLLAMNATIKGAIEATSLTISSAIANAVVSAGGGMPSITSFSTGKLFNNVLAYSNGTASITGYIIISTPVTFANFMCDFHLSGYNYLAGSNTIDLSIGGYISTGSIVNTGFVSKGTLPIAKVQLAKDSAGNVVIILGLVSSVWNYPKIYVDKAMIGHGSPPDTFKDNWSATIGTSLSSFTIITDVPATLLENTVASQTKATAAQTAAAGYTDTKALATISAAQTYADGKANAAQVNALAGASTDATAKMNAAQSAAAILSQQLVDGIKIGGRNYFSKTTVINVYSGAVNPAHVNGTASNGYVIKNGLLVTGSSDGNSVFRLWNVITGNGNWTVSGYLKCNAGTTMYVDICDGATSAINYLQADANAGNWVYFEVTKTVTNWSAATYNFVDFGNLAQLYFGFQNLKVEQGTKASDWTPAPEDVDAAILLAKDAGVVAQSSYATLTAALKSMAYVDLDGLEGLTTINKGGVTTIKLDAAYVKANMINAAYITALDIVAKTLAADNGTIGGWAIGTTSINSIYSGELAFYKQTILKNDGSIELKATQGGYKFNPVTGGYDLVTGETVTNSISPTNISMRANTNVVASFVQMGNSSASVALLAQAPKGGIAAQFNGAVELLNLYYIGAPGNDSYRKTKVQLHWENITDMYGAEHNVLTFVEL